MDLVLCKCKEYNQVWNQTIPSNRKTTELPAISFLDIATDVLYVLDDDIKIYSRPKRKIWCYYLQKIINIIHIVLIASIIVCTIIYTALAPLHTLNDVFKFLVICLLAAILITVTALLGED